MALFHQPQRVPSVRDMHLTIETVTTAQGRMDVIRDIETVTRLNDVAEQLANRLRLWSTDDGEMLCAEDAAALKEWDALSPNAPASANGQENKS